MEQKNHHQQTENQQVQLVLWKTFEPISSLSIEENKILANKYKSMRFGDMDESDRITSGRILLFKIFVITGWEIPVDPDIKTVLVDQFSKKLSESYATVNADEIEFAFRSNTSVKDWGKTMNLFMIDEVMAPYLERRVLISWMEEQAKKPKELPGYKVHEMTDEQLLNAAFESFKVIKKHEFIPPWLYDYLITNGDIVITNDEKKAIKMQVEAVIKADSDTRMNYETASDKDRFLKDACRKFTVAKYFQSLIEKGC